MADTENILQTIKSTIEDLVAPDVRELRVRIDALHSQIAAHAQQSDAQYRSLLAAISQSRAEAELSGFRALADVRERLAALEARQQ